MSKISFICYCVENYAEHTKVPSNKVYALLKKEGLIDHLYTDYQDLHGMGTEFLMDYIDKYLGVKK